MIVVDPGNDRVLQPASETKVQERKERAAEKKAKEDACRQEIRSETAARRKKSRGDVYARKVVEGVMLMGLQSNDTDVKKLTYKQVVDSLDSNRWEEVIQVEVDVLKRLGTFSEPQ